MANEISIAVSAKKSTVKSDMKKAEGEAKEGAKGINSALKGIGEVAAGAEVLEFGKQIFEAAETSEKASKLTEAAIKSTGGAANVTAEDVDNLSNKISGLTGAQADAIHSGANLLLTFTNVRNEAGKGNDIFDQATQTVTDMTAALNNGSVTADGLKSSSIQLGKALNDPIKGITALGRVGVTFTEEQKKTIAGDMKRNDIMGAQKIILGELNREFGGAAAAQATPADKASAAWHNFQVELGEKLMPTVDQLLNDLIKFLPVLMAIIDNTVKFAEANKPLVAFLAAVIAGIKVWTIVQAILDSELIANPIGAIIMAIVALVAVIIYVATKTRFFQDTWQAVWDFMKGVGHWFSHDFVDFFTSMWKDISNAFTKANSFIVGSIQKYLIDPILNLFSVVINGAAKAFGWVPGLGGKLKTAAKNFDNFKDEVNAALNKIQGKKTINVNAVFTVGSGGTARAGFADGGIVGAAAGGIQGGLRWVGERGAELVKLPSGSMVYPHGQSMGMASQGGGGGDVQLVFSEMSPLGQAVMKQIRIEVRNGGGGLRTLGLKPLNQQPAS